MTDATKLASPLAIEIAEKIIDSDAITFGDVSRVAAIIEAELAKASQRWIPAINPPQPGTLLVVLFNNRHTGTQRSIADCPLHPSATHYIPLPALPLPSTSTPKAARAEGE